VWVNDTAGPFAKPVSSNVALNAFPNATYGQYEGTAFPAVGTQATLRSVGCSARGGTRACEYSASLQRCIEWV
jgi:hypothetical protein